MTHATRGEHCVDSMALSWVLFCKSAWFVSALLVYPSVECTHCTCGVNMWGQTLIEWFWLLQLAIDCTLQPQSYATLYASLSITWLTHSLNSVLMLTNSTSKDNGIRLDLLSFSLYRPTWKFSKLCSLHRGHVLYFILTKCCSGILVPVTEPRTIYIILARAEFYEGAYALSSWQSVTNSRT